MKARALAPAPHPKPMEHTTRSRPPDFFSQGYSFPIEGEGEEEKCRELKRPSYYVPTCPDSGGRVMYEDDYVKFSITSHSTLENDGKRVMRYHTAHVYYM